LVFGIARLRRRPTPDRADLPNAGSILLYFSPQRKTFSCDGYFTEKKM
jgi:hypothetical protein